MLQKNYQINKIDKHIQPCDGLKKYHYLFMTRYSMTRQKKQCGCMHFKNAHFLILNLNLINWPSPMVNQIINQIFTKLPLNPAQHATTSM